MDEKERDALEEFRKRLASRSDKEGESAKKRYPEQGGPFYLELWVDHGDETVYVKGNQAALKLLLNALTDLARENTPVGKDYLYDNTSGLIKSLWVVFPAACGVR